MSIPTYRATLYIEIIVNCPKCDNYIDILDENDTDGYPHNDCGQALNDAIGDDWGRDMEEFSVEEITCSECKHIFDVKGLDW